MNNKNTLNISIWILLVSCCAGPHDFRKDGIRLNALTNESSPSNRGGIMSDDGSISVSLQNEEKSLNYRINIRGHDSISVRSGHDVEGQRPKFGEDIIVNIRDDRKAMVISEWEKSAVAETDPIYINWAHGEPKITPYTTKKIAKLPEGAGAKIVFLGWLADGTPEMRVQPE